MSYDKTLTGSGWLVGPIVPAGSPADAGLLFFLKGADFNVAADQQLQRAFAFKDFLIDKIVVTNASVSLTTVAGGVYTAAAKSGVALVAASQAYTALVDSGKALTLTLANTERRTDAAAPYLSLTTPQGGAATADIYVYGVPCLPTT